MARGSASSSNGLFFMAGLLAAAVFVAGIVWTQPDLVRTLLDEPEANKPKSTLMQPNVYFARCRDARAAGAAPINVGEPGYRIELDADRDGVACEPWLY